MIAAELAALAVGALDVALVGSRTALALRYAARYPTPREHDGEGVAILVAILSGDPLLEPRLAKSLELLPRARFHWLIDEDDPEAQRITSTLVAAHPSSRITVEVHPPPPPGVNPKMLKLERALPGVREPIVVILDDDTLLPGTSLGALVEGLSRATLTTGLPRYQDDGRFASRLLSQFVNQNAAVTYLMLPNFRAPITINGMTWAMRTEERRRVAGMVVTETSRLAAMVEGSSYRLEQLTDLVRQTLSPPPSQSAQ